MINRNNPSPPKPYRMALPDFKLNVEPSQLAPLAAILRRHDYTESGVRGLLQNFDNGEMIGDRLPYYKWQCDQNPSPLATLTKFFLLGEGATREELLELLGMDLCVALQDCDALIGYDGVFTSKVVLYPCQGYYLFTDYWYVIGHQTKGKIYEIGTDSYVLARTTPRVGVKNALDLCTGSGIHAIMSAAAAPSKAVDINPRALEYTKANAALNSVEVETFLGDLFTALESEETFDLITMNPPFVPSPDPDVVLIHRSPGETGEEVSHRVVSSLNDRLDENGLFSMILEYPVMEGELYVDRLEKWLGGDGTGWGIAVLWYVHRELSEYVVSHIGPVESYLETFNNYLDSYKKHGITAIRFASVFIKKLPPGHPNWKVMERVAPWPREDVKDDIHVWLDCLTRYNDPSWRPAPDWKPKLSRYYKSAWRDWDDERGVMEATDDNWLPTTRVDAHATDLLMRLKKGEKTVAELQADWLEDGMDEASLLQAFRTLGALRGLE